MAWGENLFGQFFMNQLITVGMKNAMMISLRITHGPMAVKR